jgi:hypothetical protein
MVQDEKHAHNASVPVITTPLWSLLMLPMVLSSTPDHDWGMLHRMTNVMNIHHLHREFDPTHCSDLTWPACPDLP